VQRRACDLGGVVVLDEQHAAVFAQHGAQRP
jgi:hypothetical protein